MEYIEMDQIRITGLKIYAYHGVLLEEKEKGQDFYINATLFLDCHKAGKTDALSDALNYAEACAFMTEVFTKQSYDLIEKACEEVATQMLLHFPSLHGIEVEVNKPHAPIGLPFENVSVCMKRAWHKAYLSFGSNMGDRHQYVKDGIAGLQAHPLIRNVKVSNLIETDPYGPVEQDAFLNGAMELETILSQEELLCVLHDMEQQANRVRKIVWGPRTLDMDIVFYDHMVYESDTLIIPHVDMQNRLFVLEPLMELCPNYRHPILGKTVRQMLEDLK